MSRANEFLLQTLRAFKLLVRLLRVFGVTYARYQEFAPATEMAEN
jgi:hypothetical protein